MQPLYSLLKVLFIFRLNNILEYVSKIPEAHGIVDRTDCAKVKLVQAML